MYIEFFYLVYLSFLLYMHRANTQDLETQISNKKHADYMIERCKNYSSPSYASNHGEIKPEYSKSSADLVFDFYQLVFFREQGREQKSLNRCLGFQTHGNTIDFMYRNTN